MLRLSDSESSNLQSSDSEYSASRDDNVEEIGDVEKINADILPIALNQKILIVKLDSNEYSW